MIKHIKPTATWEHLALPQSMLIKLRDIYRQAKHRCRVSGRKSTIGNGLIILFSGQNDTGKTMAAEVLANELRLDLCRVDLSAVVSKYVGETEKNLRQVFDAAEVMGSVLFFDEADALFGKRTEVKNSHDRYASIEIDHLLQLIEAYEGVAILTTKMKEVIDEAFLRRILYVIEFPIPQQRC